MRATGASPSVSADAPEYLIGGAGFSPARPPAGVKEIPLSEDQVTAETKVFMARIIDKGLFSGTLLVAKGDQVLLTMAAGEASKAFHVPNNIDTKFNLGSMNKMFTSTAIVQLAEKGKLSLDDPIGKYLDESWLPKDVTDKITIRHLLTHSSGLGSYFNETYDKSSRELFRKLDDYKPLIKDDRPAFEPGTQFQYSNTGMFLLGVIIEKVTGEDYFELHPEGDLRAGRHDEHRLLRDGLPGREPGHRLQPRPEEPLRLAEQPLQACHQGRPGRRRILDGQGPAQVRPGPSRRKIRLQGIPEGHVDGSPGSRTTASGFSVSRGAAGKVVGHGGGFDGINSNLDIFVDSGYIVAVMSNTDRGASPVAAKIAAFLGRVGPTSITHSNK